MTEALTIRRVTAVEDLQVVEDIQRAAWGMQEDSALVPLHLLITAEHRGGLVLGAYTSEGRMVGFLFGFIGRLNNPQENEPDGEIAEAAPDERIAWMGTPYLHCSHMMGVLPEYQGRSVGYQLKCAQRRYVLAQGLRLIVWTYDPLLSVNAWLNIERLGGICRCYIPNLYGEIKEEINAGLPTDRFELEWWLTSERVAARLKGKTTHLSPAAWQAEGAELINTTAVRSDRLRAPNGWTPRTQSTHLLVEIPGDFQAIKRTDLDLGLAWRLHAREIFEWAFSNGYTAAWFTSENTADGRRSYYVLNRNMDIPALAGGQHAH